MVKPPPFRGVRTGFTTPSNKIQHGVLVIDRDDYRRDVIAGIWWDQTGKRGDILSYSEILIKCRLLNWMPNRRVMETIVSPLDLHPG